MLCILLVSGSGGEFVERSIIDGAADERGGRFRHQKRAFGNGAEADARRSADALGIQRQIDAGADHGDVLGA